VKAWIAGAEPFVFKHIEDPELIKIQIILVLIFYYIVPRNIKKIMMLLFLASRMAYLTRLNYECNNMPFIVTETRRRLMWAIFVQDKFFSAGLMDFTLCQQTAYT
jgi:hypothetical protein